MKKRMKSVRNTRKAVATLANKLRKYLKDLSRAFRKAWKLVKRGVNGSRISKVSEGGIDDHKPTEANRHTKVCLYYL